MRSENGICRECQRPYGKHYAGCSKEFEHYCEYRSHLEHEKRVHERTVLAWIEERDEAKARLDLRKRDLDEALDLLGWVWHMADPDTNPEWRAWWDKTAMYLDRKVVDTDYRHSFEALPGGGALGPVGDD